MEIEETLLKCKEELNFLYRTEPFDTPTGVDYGWFCREHALHVFLLLALAKVASQFASGHVYGSFAANDIPIRTLNSGANHWWVVSDLAKPIDFSITPAQITAGTLTYVWGKPEPVIDFAYVDTEQAFHSAVNRFKKGIGLAYYEQSRIDVSPLEVLRNPSQIVIIPSDGGIQATIHPEIFSAITLHLWKVAHGRTPPLNRRAYNWIEAMQIIASQNLLPTSRLRKILEEKK